MNRRDLRWAVEAEGNAHGADAAVDVELHAGRSGRGPRRTSCPWGEDERADEGEADLAAVGVAGEHQVDERAAGMGEKPSA